MTQLLHIIAEAGTNHGGSLEKAIELMTIAKKAGADSVKFQMIYPEGLYLPQIYKDGNYTDNIVFSMRKDAMLSDEEYEILAKKCYEKKIGFSASVFDDRGIKLLNKLNSPYIKIASCDLNNAVLLKTASASKKKLIVSTGMASLGEIEKAVSLLVKGGNNDIVLMHCVSIYPCQTEKMNLNFIKVLKEAFGFPVGLSDHTETSTAGIIAVAMGAEWIEKHFTYDRTAKGFDHSYAMEPEMLRQYIKEIRTAHKACEKQAQKICNDERSVKERARRGLYASRDILEGEVITMKDVLIVRPEGCLSPEDSFSLEKKRSKSLIRKYEALDWRMFE